MPRFYRDFAEIVTGIVSEIIAEIFTSRTHIAHHAPLSVQKRVQCLPLKFQGKIEKSEKCLAFTPKITVNVAFSQVGSLEQGVKR